MSSPDVMPEDADQLPLDNDGIADRLEEVADLLEAQDANPFRVRAYRNAAETVRSLGRPVPEILAEEGADGLAQLPGIGRSLGRSIEQLAESGHLALLSRLRGDLDPERVFATVPGIGPELAERVHEELGIETLGDLEIAAHDGRLGQLPGFGRKRVEGIRDALAGRFRRGQRVPDSRRPRLADEQPSVGELLDIDNEYREKAAADRLLRIAPRRFNPEGKAWLPIMHTHRGERHYTALFSNTARAHELGTTGDWVVIYRDDHGGEGQWTVITSRFGSLKGRRIIRGRERECKDWYDSSAADATFSIAP